MGKGFTVIATAIKDGKPRTRTIKDNKGRSTSFKTKKEAEVARKKALTTLGKERIKKFQIKTRVIKL